MVGERGVVCLVARSSLSPSLEPSSRILLFLLMDEAATSALDSQTERQLQSALNKPHAGRSSLTIAHRLSTIINCDTIIVMDAGRGVEVGLACRSDRPGWSL